MESGSKLEFAEVLFLDAGNGGARIGTPRIPGAKVVAKVLGEIKGDKIVVAKFRRRKNYRRRIGHRQPYLRIQIESIHAG
jgi:large subunit ribosomal protein L21